MSIQTNPLTKATMSEAQRACFDLLCECFHGESHTPESIYACGAGIKCSTVSQGIATFDFDYLTRLVVLAHDRCIRVEIGPGDVGGVSLMLHKRSGREGRVHERHPTIEEAIRRVRGAQLVAPAV